MAQIDVTYEGNQECTAISTRNNKHIAIDCPMTKGEAYGPDGLVAAGLGSCILISMGGFAERHGLDISGSSTDVDVSLIGGPEARISEIDVTIHVPHSFSNKDRASLERAAAACPIKYSLRPDTKISSHFVYIDK